jgi:hypothetical protein
MPNEDHGDRRNLTMRDLEQAGEAANISPDQVVRNIQDTVQTGQGFQGQSTGENIQSDMGQEEERQRGAA